MSDLKNLFVFVPSNTIDDFKANHIGNVLSSDEYYNKVSFLSGSGEIAARGELFGMSKAFEQKIGLTNDITTSNTLMAYIASLGGQIDTLNQTDSHTGSVDYKIKQAIDTLVADAPAAYDTITEIATWLTEIQGDNGTAAIVAAKLAKINPLEEALGTYSVTNNVGTYTGSYLFAVNAATDAINSLSISDQAVAGQYISQITLSNGTFNITRANLPTVIDNIGNTSGISHSTSEDVTTYTATTETISTDGLITYSALYARLHATEVYLATTLTDIDARIHAAANNATSGAIGGLDSSITLNATENGTSYASVTIVEENGVLTSTGSSLTINRNNILAKTEATVASPTTGTGANEYVKVNVVTENHDVKSVTVEFDPWEVYTPSQQGD